MAFGSKTIESIEGKLETDLKTELGEQGHRLTGALEDSVASITEEGNGSVAVEVFAEGYINPVNDGVTPAKIPYDSSQRTGAKTSLYIEGLKNYAMLRFGISDEKEATSAAFAIAKTHEKEGMPTKGSYAHSNNGKRTQAIDRTLSENEGKYELEVHEGISREIDDVLEQDFDIKII